MSSHYYLTKRHITLLPCLLFSLAWWQKGPNTQQHSVQGCWRDHVPAALARSLSLALLGGWICLVKCCGMRNSHGRVFSSEAPCHPPMEQQNGPKDGRWLSLNWLSIVRHPHYDDNKDDGPARCNFPSKRPKIDCRTSQTALLAGCLVLVGKNPSYSSCGAREREEQSLLRFFHRKTNAGTSAGHTLYTCFNSFLYVVNLPLSFPVRRSLDEWSMLACVDDWRLALKPV